MNKAERHRRKPACSYCHGHGIDAHMWDCGHRWVNGREPRYRSYACDRCGMPKELPPAPVEENG